MLRIVVGNDTQRSGSIARAWGDVLRRLRKYVGGRWTVNQCIVLHRIFMDHLDGRDSTVRSVCTAENISQQTVSNAVAALRAVGLVHEEPHPVDARSKLLVPTEKAMNMRSRWWSEAVGID